jgi:hypothetical protein
MNIYTTLAKAWGKVGGGPWAMAAGCGGRSAPLLVRAGPLACRLPPLRRCRRGGAAFTALRFAAALGIMKQRIPNTGWYSGPITQKNIAGAENQRERIYTWH